MTDGTCESCGGQLKIIGTDYELLEVECLACRESFYRETDDFNRNGTDYWSQAKAAFNGGQ
jgi:hypothetical protein